MECLTLFFFASCLFSFANPLMTESQIKQVLEKEVVHGVQTYIVHVAKPNGSGQLLRHEDLESWHRSFLPRTTLQSGKPRLVYSYRHAISGFAARLTLDEVKAMEAMDGFLHAQRDRTFQLTTTYSPTFLGLAKSNGAWSSTRGEGIIVGVLDSGILPTHVSFNDTGMPPPPAKWKGGCAFENFSCNNKIIGGAEFLSEQPEEEKTLPVIDIGGHGTHTASTIAGTFVQAANFIGEAKRTASGVAPKAHLAIYKIASSNAGCHGSDVLAGIDQAIIDGVDVLSMSIGGPPDGKIYEDAVAIGSLSAANHGISTVSCTGNEGPSARTLNHNVPWVLTAGASSTDRTLMAVVKLGNGVQLYGQSAYQPDMLNSSLMLPIVYPGSNGEEATSYCTEDSLDDIDVKGKVVLCWTRDMWTVSKGEVVLAAGGAAMILMNWEEQGLTTYPGVHVLPTSHLSFTDGRIIRQYVYSIPTPRASITFKGTKSGYSPAPGLAAFSSRGPSTVNGGILKPDVMAPGVNILAAWPSDANPGGFTIMSGTSMAAPHVAGVAALVKSKHRSWSPAAVHSAIITTAYDSGLDGKPIVDEYTGKEADISFIGAGHVNPTVALNPGLVYDLKPSEYIPYMCGLGYNDTEVSVISRQSIKCSSIPKQLPWQLNYPSIGVIFGPGFTTTLLTRTVTNVGAPDSVYTARVTEPDGVVVRLSHYQLRFSKGQPITATFNVLIILKAPVGITEFTTFRGKIQFISNNHVVTSPIAILYKP